MNVDGAWIGFGAVAAAFIGPIAAVLVTRWVDHRRERYSRRLQVFRTLMQSRRVPTSPEFVGALNLVEVEFFDCPNVMASWKAMLDHFSNHEPSNEEGWKRWLERADVLRADLLSNVAKELRIPVPQLEIFRGGYAPKAWTFIEDEQQTIRRLFADVARGTRALPVVVYQPPAHPDTQSDQSRT